MAFSPSEPLPKRAQCALYINDEFTLINDCEYVDTDGGNVYIIVISTNFTDFQKDGDGSCIYLVNCGILANQTCFIDCESTSKTGGGGAIFINNTLNIGHNVTFIDLLFLRCRAYYGGAVFLQSSSEKSINLIHRCRFLNNQAYGKKSSNDKYNFLYGGSAMLLMAKRLNFENCSFHYNHGSSAVKVWNLFDNDVDKLSLLNEKYEHSLSFVGCEFEKEEKSKSSIFYIDESNGGNKLEITSCNFKGKLKDGSHYIDGFLREPKNVLVNSCKFENEVKNAMNFNIITDSLEIEMNAKVGLNEANIYFWIVIVFILVLSTTMFSLITLRKCIYCDSSSSNEKILEP